MTKVLIASPLSEDQLERIQSVAPYVEIEQLALPDGRWPADRSTDAEVLYAASGIPKPSQAPDLRWLQVHWAGVDHLRDDPIWNSDVQITSASGIHAPTVAQYVMAQLLAWSNRVYHWREYQAEGKWPSDRWHKYLPHELRGSTLGILGYGSIGRELTRLSKAFGMRVLVTKRDARKMADFGYALPDTGDPAGTLADRIYPSEAAPSVVKESDYVVVCLPLTDKTTHLVNEELLRAMKPDCFLINIGRGGVVNESDLVRALRKRWIAGAGLDVFENEPLPPESPLWQMENVVITPHIAGFTADYNDRVAILFAENLRRYLAGEQLLNVVDREIGY